MAEALGMDPKDVFFFLLNRVQYNDMRDYFYAKVDSRHVRFTDLNDNEKYSFLMTNTDPFTLVLVWLDIFIHYIFINTVKYWRISLDGLSSIELCATLS